MRNSVRILLILVLCATFCLSFAGCKRDYPEGLQYKYVALIGVDGAGAFFKNTRTPNLDRIFRGYARTYKAVAASPTISGQCWGSILHGVEPEKHGLTNEIAASKPYDVNSAYPSIFKVIRQSMPNADLASFTCWSAINKGIIEDDLNVYKHSAYDETLIEDVLSYLDTSQPTLLFVHFESPDMAGHEYEYRSKEYYAALRLVDTYVGRIFDKYEQLGILDETLFIVTTDHGGHGLGHGTEEPSDKQIFLGVRGFNVNSVRIDGCQGKDVAAIIVKALDVEPCPNWTAKVPEKLFMQKIKKAKQKRCGQIRSALLS